MFKKLSKIMLIGILLCVAVYLGVFIGRTSSANTISLASLSTEEKNINSNNINYKIDLNRATIDELIEIPGVGPATAKEIINYRTLYGDYYDVRELLKIDCISQELYETICQYVDVKD